MRAGERTAYGGCSGILLLTVSMGLALACAVGPDDDARRNAAGSTDDWLSHGRGPAERRFSPLAEIHDGNVQSLGLAWSFDTDTTRGLEATPLVYDGIRSRSLQITTLV